MPATSNHVTSCTLCDGYLVPVLALAPTPPANEILPSYDPEKELYPLNLMICQICQHLQLDTEISMFRLFKHYVYTSNTSASNLAYFDTFAQKMTKRFHPKFVIDIGGNDGTFLHFFQRDGMKVLNVNPAENIAEIAEANGVETKVAFFNELVATQVKGTHGASDLITCINMFAHNRNLGEVLLGVKNLLSEQGTFVFEVSYAMKLLEKNLCDLIYHEHFHHWHLLPAIEYFKKFGLRVYDAELVPETHGGSIRVFVQHSERFHGVTRRLKNLLQEEKDTFQGKLDNFQKAIPKVKTTLTTILDILKKQNKQIAILGYPAKACTLSYYFNLDKYITHVYDDNPLKIGKYTHQGLKIEPTSFIYKNKPDYLLLLSWNYKDELLEKHKLFRQTGGKFIVPFPEPGLI